MIVVKIRKNGSQDVHVITKGSVLVRKKNHKGKSFLVYAVPGKRLHCIPYDEKVVREYFRLVKVNRFIRQLNKIWRKES